jgi:hypothetical protein
VTLAGAHGPVRRGVEVGIVKFWIGLALVLVLMLGTLYLFVIQPTLGHPAGYHWVCAPDGSSCVDEAY